MLSRILLVVALLTSTLLGGVAGSASAQSAPDWAPAVGSSDLLRSTWWEEMPSATMVDGMVRLTGSGDLTPLVHRWGPRLPVQGDFRVQATLQSGNGDLAVLAIADVVPEANWWPGMRRIEVGIEGGQLVVGTFDGVSFRPVTWEVFDEAPAGPVALDVTRTGGMLSVVGNGQQLVQMPDTGLFPSGRAFLGSRVAPDNTLTLSWLALHAPREVASDTRVERCAPDRLLFTSADANDVNTGIAWLNLNDPAPTPRVIEATSKRPSFMVAASPDTRWVAYYQRSGRPTDRFVVDGWVLDLATDQRLRLIEENAPMGWLADTSAVILRERPIASVRVPSGEEFETNGRLVTPDAMLAMTSPDGKYRAIVTPGGQGSQAGVEIIDLASREPHMSVVASRGAVMLAWSPDSSRLAYTSAQSGPAGLEWRLQIAEVASKRIWMPESVRDTAIHSVVWVPELPGCAA